MDVLFLGPALAVSAFVTLLAAKGLLQVFLTALERRGRAPAAPPQ